MLRGSAVRGVLFLFLAGCASATAVTPGGTTVFEVEYVNFAWVATWRGFAIDSTGAIRSYDLKGQPWRPGNDDFPTRAELAAKHATDSQPHGDVDPATLAAMQFRADRAGNGALSEPTGRCADAGTLTYSAWLYDPDEDAFRRVLLWREGDIAQLNQSTDARAIAEWLKALQLLPQLQGCQPF
jgi:hypothetical protein